MLDWLPQNPWLVAAPILLAAFGEYIAYRNNYKSRRAAAGAQFRAAITNALTGLYPLPAKWPANPERELQAAFPAIQAAVAQFRPFVPWWRRSAYDRAWLTYRSAYLREIDVQCYHHYIAFEGQPDPQATFKKNVGRLLGFAGAP
ncbi:MAG TPA: hypothetical protein DCM36_06850 [Xanthomonadaceae bacterium]|nr:hypothetical protein [Xanthomonadaceae bacterium]